MGTEFLEFVGVFSNIIPAWKSDDTAGKAIHQVAKDSFIKPSKTANINKSRIGSVVLVYTLSDIEGIGNPKQYKCNESIPSLFSK